MKEVIQQMKNDRIEKQEYTIQSGVDFSELLHN